MEEKKKKSTGKTVVIIVLVLLLVAAVGYIGYDKFLVKENNTIKEESDEKQKDSEKKLDINSRLVQTLYNSVSEETEKASYYVFWKDYEYNDSSFYEYGLPKDIYVKSMSDEVKMQYVANNLNTEKEKFIICDSNIKEIAGMHSGCNSEYSDYGSTTYLTKSLVETTYKNLFGEDYNLNTSIAIRMDVYGGKNYVYDSNLNKYIIYYREVGGTTGPGGYITKLKSAKQTSKEIKIYEDVKLEYYSPTDSTASNPLYKEGVNVYTFELADDGLYNFVSRVKES